MKNYQAKLLLGSMVAIQANQIDQKATTDLQSLQQETAEQQAQWGFLKNIVNIDSFFSSGKEPAGGKKAQVKKASKVQKKADKKDPASADFNTDEITLSDKKKPAKKGSLAQAVKDGAKSTKKNETKKAAAQRPSSAAKKETKAAPAKKEVDPLEQEMMEDITGAKAAVKETTQKPTSAAEKPKKKPAQPAAKAAKKTVQKQASADDVGGVAEDSLEEQEKILNRGKPKKETKKAAEKKKDKPAPKPTKKKEEEAPVEKDESQDEEAIKAAASMAVDGEESEDNSDQQNAQFDEPAEFVIISAKDASDTSKDVKTTTKSISSQSEANEFFKGVSGQKLMFVNGQLFKSNVDSGETAYYRLVGEAYNNKKLNRAQLSSDAAKPGSSFYTYVIDGVPQTMEHSAENDKKYGYSKQVFNKVNTQGDSLAQTNGSSKLFSASCNKLKYNASKDRLNQCNLASGYFIVHEQQLFMEPLSKDLSDYGIKVAE